MTELGTALANYGPIGVTCAILLYLFLRKERELAKKDAELAAERLARISDVKDFTKLALDLQKGVNDNVQKLADMFETLQKAPPPRYPR